MEKVAYLLIAYNQSKYILSALISAFNQTYPNLLLVICDDASTDGTKEIILDFLETNQSKHRVKTIFNINNMGFSSFLNIIHEKITAKYFIYSSGDDISSIHKTDVAVSLFEEKKASAIVSDVYYIDKNGIKIEGNIFKLPMSPYEHYNRLNLPYHLIALSGDLIKRVSPIPTGNYAEDQLFMRIAIMCKQFGIVFTKRRLVTYRVANESVIGRLNKSNLEAFRTKLRFLLETNNNILKTLQIFDENDFVTARIRIFEMFKLENYAISNCERNFFSRTFSVIYLTANAKILGHRDCLRLSSLLLLTPRFYQKFLELRNKVINRLKR